MATFFMFGKYNADTVKDISITRTQKGIEEIKKLGGVVIAMHALLGEYDLMFCVDLPDIESAMKASVALTQLTGVSFSTCPGITIEAFDRVMTE
ncbi:MAG: GYD domain-containing protein [Desulfobacterales bacterium]